MDIQGAYTILDSPKGDSFTGSLRIGVVETEVASPEGKPFLMRILPYRTGTQSVDGIIIAFIDIVRLKATELELRETARKLNETNEELTSFNKMTVGREMAMIELKQEINDLLNDSGKPPKYEIPK